LVENVPADASTGAPGLFILADDLSLVAASEPVQEWLRQIADRPQRKELPQVVYGLARRLQEAESSGEGAASLNPRVRVRTASGRWLVLHAMRLVSASSEGGRIAVILEPAAAPEVASVVFQAYGLTQREVEIAQHVLKGTATQEIADALCISLLTVRQHLKAVFEKSGVSSRRELSARMLYEQYAPNMMAGATPSIHGGFLRG
jgi:DNA-binding CsgD family transcriptional regulator